MGLIVMNGSTPSKQSKWVGLLLQCMWQCKTSYLNRERAIENRGQVRFVIKEQ